MNTFRMYEDFREAFGEPAAKVLAQTLGGMFEELRNTVTKDDFRGLSGEIDRHVSRLDNALVRLADAQGRTEQRVEELAQAQNRTEQRVEELGQAQKDTQKQIEQLTAAQRKTETELHLLVKVVKRQAPRLDAALGRSLELQFRDRMCNYLWRFLKQGRLVSLAELSSTLEAALDEESLDDLSRADAIATGFVDGKETFIVVEVSSKADANDVSRVLRWAALLQKAGLPAIPMVACDFMSDQAMRFAVQQGVRVFKQGRLLAIPAA
ncbi:hypothetical protein EBR04_00375 [bacterium]|nr:hypothetical protein [bacterium]